MTRAGLEKIVRTWQKRLRLDHWDITVDWTKAAAEDANATIFRRHTYDKADIYLDPGFVNWTEKFAHQVMVHELMHLVTRDVDRVVASVEDCLHKDAFKLFDSRYEHEIEGVVDRMAIILVDLAGTA